MVASQQSLLLFHPAIREQQFAVIRMAALEDSVDGMQKFALHGHQRLQAGLMPLPKRLVKGAHMRIVAHRRQGRHIEGAPQMTIAGTADMRWLMDGSSRHMMRRVQPAISYPLPYGHGRRQQHQLAQDM